MEQITYKHASEILNVVYGTIKQAVTRGNLTRVAERDKQTYLIKEQVDLFKGKNRISIRALNTEELEQWTKYKSIAEGKINADNTLNNNITTEALAKTFSASLETAVNTRIDETIQVKFSTFGEILSEAFKTAFQPSLRERGRL